MGIKKIVGNVMGDSLYRNSIYMMVSTLVMAGFGFVFWMVASRLYLASDIGLATGIISIMGLIVGLSALGLNVGLIRYLPGQGDRNKKINSCFTLVVIATVIVSSVYLLGISKFSPSLVFIKESVLLSFVFILFMVVASVGSLVDSIYVALRNSKYILVKNSVFSVLKVLGLFFFVAFGAFGIFASWMIGMMIAVGVVVGVLMLKYEYRPEFVFYNSIIRKMGTYSFGNYVAGFVGGLPLMILPILILNRLGSEMVAYYYMAMMVAGLLFAVPQAVAQSLFAEGSWAEEGGVRGEVLGVREDEGRRKEKMERGIGTRIKNRIARMNTDFFGIGNKKMGVGGVGLEGQVLKGIKIIGMILVPGILVVWFFGDLVLLAFGAEYATEGFGLLRVLGLSGVFVALNGIMESLLKVREMVWERLFVNVLKAVFIIGGVYFLLDNGLIWIGYGWLVGVGLTSLVYFVVFGRGRGR